MVVGIDIGTTKVCSLIADVGGGAPEILGVGICPSHGLRKGVVVDIKAASDAVLESLEQAEQQSGFKAMSVVVGIAGSHILSSNSHAVIAVRSPDHVVSAEDVTRVIDGARIIQLPPDQEILHVVPRHFIVDGVEGIMQPVGMVGRRLELEANIVTASSTSIHSLMRCVQAANVQLEDLVLEPLAAGRAVLTEAERELGCMIIDMGGGTTDSAIFRDGGLAHSFILPVGGAQITNDLAVGLRVPLPTAEEIKIRYGSTIAYLDQDSNAIRLPQGSRPDGGPEIDQHLVAEIIEARLAETYDFVLEEMGRAGFAEAFAAGVVLCGGSSQISGAAALASEIFGAPVRVGAAIGLHGLKDAIRGPAFATSVGLLLWGGDHLGSPGPQHESRIGRIGAAVRSWLRDFLG